MSILSKYIEYQKGTSPVIISVPHGGSLECKEIPERKTGILGIDKSTIEFAKELTNQVCFQLKDSSLEPCMPSSVISHVPRSKIDLNREDHEAYQPESLLAREIYNLYHDKIYDIVIGNIKQFNYSLLIDLHGFEKDKRPTGFRDVDIILGTNNLGSFFSEPILKKDWDKNFRGKMIKKFLDLNIPIAPGHPRRREYVLTGGFIIQQYGASNVHKSQAIQIEISDKIRLYDNELKSIVLTVLTDVISEELANMKL